MDVVETVLSMQTNDINRNSQAPYGRLQTIVYNAVNDFLVANKGKSVDDLYDRVLQEVEPPLLKLIMEKHRNNQVLTAKILGISRGTVRKKLLRYFGTQHFRLTD